MSPQADTLYRSTESERPDRPSAEVVDDTHTPEAATSAPDTVQDATAAALDEANRFAIPGSEMLDPGAVASTPEDTTPEIKDEPGYVEQKVILERIGAGVVMLRQAELARTNSGS